MKGEKLARNVNMEESGLLRAEARQRCPETVCYAQCRLHTARLPFFRGPAKRTLRLPLMPLLTTQVDLNHFTKTNAADTDQLTQSSVIRVAAIADLVFVYADSVVRLT